MLASAIPYKFATPWASGAGAGFITGAIPLTSTGGAASQTLGYPPITATLPSAGGIPPNVADENGVLNYSTAWLLWQQAGGPMRYDATFSAAIGGYPAGALLLAASFPWFWMSSVDNNTTNPDAGGAGWSKWDGGAFPRYAATVAINTTWTRGSVGTFVSVGVGGTVQTITTASFASGDTIGFSADAAATITLSSGVFKGGLVTGSTSVAMAAGSWLAVQFDGTSWRLFSASPDLLGYLIPPSETTFTASGSWTCPALVTSIIVDAAGGGGGGGGGVGSGNGGAGGGGGAAVVGATLAVVPGTTYTVTIGAAGSAGASSGGNGGAGGTTSLGALLSLGGGGGGVGNGGGSAASGGAGGTASLAGSFGAGAISTGGAGGSSLFGAGGSGNTASGITGQAGSGFGGGGGGGSNVGGGAGARGFIRIKF